MKGIDIMNTSIANKPICLRTWNYAGDKVKLVYEDDDIVYVSKTDFDRAFGAIVSASKTEVLRDFVLKNDVKNSS